MQCSSCGTWWGRRNFHFSNGERTFKNISEDKAEVRRIGGRESCCFDVDDTQAYEMASIERGWYMGSRNYDPNAVSTGLNVDDPAFSVYLPSPSSLPEATASDFYDARNLCGRWESLIAIFGPGPHPFKDTVARIQEAGLSIPRAVLKVEEAESWRYGPQGRDGWLGNKSVPLEI